ncbi:MAG: hypothetical protein ACI9P9_000826, partial [Patescibacteria group bacterium]
KYNEMRVLLTLERKEKATYRLIPIAASCGVLLKINR